MAAQNNLGGHWRHGAESYLAPCSVAPGAVDGARGAGEATIERDAVGTG